ncbi:MAG: glycoside hydrolase family 38 C-terminal domain-containing protein [Pirellulales bacterium]
MSGPLPRRNPLPQLTPARLRRLGTLVEEKIWLRYQQLPVNISEEQFEPIDCQHAALLPMQPLEPSTHFGRSGDHWTSFWLKIDIPAAAAEESELRYLRWRCQGETTVWIDGRPWAGLDLGHSECPIPDNECTLWLECCSWQTGIWISMLTNESIGPHGLRFEGAELAIRNPTAWNCHCDLDVIGQIMEQSLRLESDLKLATTFGYCRALETMSPRTRKLLHEIGALCDQWAETGDLLTLQSACRELLGRWPAESWQPTAAVCGHAHIDLVWLWPESATRKKIVHSFATVLRLMERYPEFLFVQSMPALYRMLEHASPAIMAQVSAHIKSGRWEVLGGFEVEPDTNLPSGEALARSIRIGQNKIQQLTGKLSEIAWIPDVFGYSQCLPQIMALGGIKYFYTTKMTWSSITKFPYTSFVWRGADGTEVLSHLGTTDYNGEMQLDAHEKACSEHRQVDVHPEQLFPTGYGDGGGGPTELHIERARRFQNLSGAPQMVWSRVDEFFSRLEKLKEQLPIYQGELYLEYHRGTYTTQSEFKRWYRFAEQGLQMLEAVRAALSMKPLPDSAWLRLLFAHFRDAIPGSSIQEVYAELNPELESIGNRAYAEAIEIISTEPDVGGGDTVAFNALPFDRVVTVRHDNESVQIHLPALGSAEIDSRCDVVHPIIEASNTLLRHDRLSARFDSNGQLSELMIDKRPVEFDGTPSFVLSPDDPVAFDAWDIDQHAAKVGACIANKLDLQVVEHSPARAVLESAPVSIGDLSELRLRYVLDAGCTHLKIEPTVNWQESHKLLRYVVPTRYLGRNARFGCPFGAIERPQLAGTEADEAMWEVPGSRWAAVQYDGGTDGLAILAESKLGYAARDGTLSISLLRSPMWPDATADLGVHTMPFALGRLHLETTNDQLSTSMAADALFSPPLLHRGVSLRALFHWQRLGSINASWCAPSVVESNAYFVRLHETAGRPGTAVLQLAHTAAGAELVDFLEQHLAELKVGRDGTIAIPYRPWQILTLRIYHATG